MTDHLLKPTRRVLLGGAAAALASPLVLRKAQAQGAFDWKKFSGQSIDVLLVKNPRSDLMQQAEKEFTEMTGIKVSSEQVPEQQQRQKAVIEFASGKPSFDVSGISLHVQKRMATKGKWFENLEPYIKNASLTSPDFDFADFGAGPVAYARQADGSNGLPGEGPFDRIVAWVAFESLPRFLLDQLSSGGVIIAPIGSEESEQVLAKLTKVGSRFEREDIGTVRLQPVLPGLAAVL